MLDLENMSSYLKKFKIGDKYDIPARVLVDEAVKIKITKSHLVSIYIINANRHSLLSNTHFWYMKERLEVQYKNERLIATFDEHPEKNYFLSLLRDFELLINSDVVCLRVKIEQAHIDATKAEKAVKAQEMKMLEAKAGFDETMSAQKLISEELLGLHSRIKRLKSQSGQYSRKCMYNMLRKGGFLICTVYIYIYMYAAVVIANEILFLQQVKSRFETNGLKLERANETYHLAATELNMVRIVLDECTQRKEMLVSY